MKLSQKCLAICFAALVAVGSGCTSKPPVVTASQNKYIDSLDQTTAGYDTWGRRWGQTPVTQTVVAAPEQTPAPEPALACASQVKTSIVDLVKKVPAQASLGEEYQCELDVTALSCIGNVVIVDHVPDGASFVRSDPVADVESNAITWKLGDMDANQTVALKVWLRADHEGSLTSCATISADPRICASTFVGKATLTLEKTGPATVSLGSNVVYNLVVKNTGTSAAHDVVVSDPVPDGLSGDPVNITVGDLGPGEAKTNTVTFKAEKRGKICNDATATASNTDKATAEACTDVQLSGLKIEKTGTTDQIIGRKATYDITVSNTGDTELDNLVVVDTAPDRTEIAEAPDATTNGPTATWTIPSLAAGDKKDLTIKLIGLEAGDRTNTVNVTAGPLSDSAAAVTAWRGVAGVRLELLDDPDPIQVGDTSTYTIKVTNQGFADLHNVGVTVEFADQVDPVDAAAGTVSGKFVNFPLVPVLGPKKTATYIITGKGVQVGDERTKAMMICDEIKSVVTKEESTTVY